MRRAYTLRALATLASADRCITGAPDAAVLLLIATPGGTAPGERYMRRDSCAASRASTAASLAMSPKPPLPRPLPLAVPPPAVSDAGIVRGGRGTTHFPPLPMRMTPTGTRRPSAVITTLPLRVKRAGGVFTGAPAAVTSGLPTLGSWALPRRHDGQRDRRAVSAIAAFMPTRRTSSASARRRCSVSATAVTLPVATPTTATIQNAAPTSVWMSYHAYTGGGGRTDSSGEEDTGTVVGVCGS